MVATGSKGWATLGAWAPVIAWAALIFWLSAQPNLRFEQDPGLDFVVRKLGHMGVFGILGLLLWRPLASGTPVRPAWAWAGLLAIGYAATDEFHQGFTEGRHPAATDVLIDGVGVVAAIVIVGVFLRWRSAPG